MRANPRLLLVVAALPLVHCQTSQSTPVAEAVQPGQSPEDRRSEMELSKRRQATLWQALDASILACYERQDQQFMRPDDQLRFRIDIADGVVADARITSSNLISYSAYRCVLEEVWAAPVSEFDGNHILHHAVYLGPDAKKRELNCPGPVMSDMHNGGGWCWDDELYGAGMVVDESMPLAGFEVRQTVRKRFKEIRACNTAKSRVGENPRRTVNVELTIASDGTVTNGVVLTSRKVDDKTAQCALDIARTTTFRASPRDVVVRVPLRF